MKNLSLICTLFLSSLFVLYDGGVEATNLKNKLNSENNSLDGKIHTFCWNDVSIQFIDGGNATMTRYGSNGSLIKQFTGSWNEYGSPTDLPGQTIKASFNGSEFSYTLIYDGFGKPSVLIDGQGRRYELCNVRVSHGLNNSVHSNNPLVGSYSLPKRGLKITVTERNGKLIAKITRNGKLITRNTSCGIVSEFIETERRGSSDDYAADLCLYNPECEKPIHEYFIEIDNLNDLFDKAHYMVFDTSLCKEISETSFRDVLKKF